MSWHLLLRDDRESDRTIIRMSESERRESFSGIRCPLCAWRPSASSKWRCDPTHTPEPPFKGCDAVWNTFATRGRCPGCDHQWIWTTCHRCAECSLHEDWYEEEESRH